MLPHGGIGTSAHGYALTIWQLPQSVITFSLVTALLPELRFVRRFMPEALAAGQQ